MNKNKDSSVICISKIQLTLSCMNYAKSYKIKNIPVISKNNKLLNNNKKIRSVSNEREGQDKLLK